MSVHLWLLIAVVLALKLLPFLSLKINSNIYVRNCKLFRGIILDIYKCTSEIIIKTKVKFLWSIHRALLTISFGDPSTGPSWLSVLVIHPEGLVDYQFWWSTQWQGLVDYQFWWSTHMVLLTISFDDPPMTTEPCWQSVLVIHPDSLVDYQFWWSIQRTLLTISFGDPPRGPCWLSVLVIHPEGLVDYLFWWSTQRALLIMFWWSTQRALLTISFGDASAGPCWLSVLVIHSEGLVDYLFWWCICRALLIISLCDPPKGPCKLSTYVIIHV